MERLEQRQQRLTVVAVVPVQAQPSAETMLPRQRLERRLRAVLTVVQEGRLPQERVMAPMPLRQAVAVAVRSLPRRPAAWVVQVAPVRSG
jgi:hypothetical protein